jgi:hypothetical protein
VTGPGHYRAAELMIEEAQDPAEPRDIPTLLAGAQVHATLALAAAHALMGEATDAGWWTVAAPEGSAPDVTR